MSEKPATQAEQLLQEKLRLLEAKFTEGLADRFAQMQASMEKALQDGLDQAEIQAELTVLHRLLHTLAGSAGTFGFEGLGLAACQLENRLKELLEVGNISKRMLQHFAEQLQETLSWAKKDPKGGVPDSITAHRIPSQSGVQAVDQDDEASSRLVYLVDDDPRLETEIKLQLQFFGYEVQLIDDLKDLATALEQKIPAAVVIELGFPSGGMAGALALASLKQKIGVDFPCIFISEDGSFDERMAAVRAGASSYFTKPVDVVALTDRLDALTAQNKKLPYRILIVDDDACSAEYYATLLRDAGMDVQILSKPQQLLAEMASYRPELVLMDMYMPEYSGVELAQLLRQDNLYLDVPIVFLSTERNYGKQLSAIECGADDFLTKPIRPSHLLSSLTSRVERYRLLRDLIMRDSLTGLYKHSTIKEQIEREVLRAKRGKTPLAFAMIDLDHFKHVNDDYGHSVGDQVIRTLSRLLQQRLRRADVIGRYGGEEFAILFPETELEAAAEVLDSLRKVFSKIIHQTEKGGFSVTFSAGVVSMKNSDEARAMIDAADQALYHAKGNGRNQVKKMLR